MSDEPTDEAAEEPEVAAEPEPAEPEPEAEPDAEAQLEPEAEAVEEAAAESVTETEAVGPAGPQGRAPRIREIDFSRPTKFGQEHIRRIVRLHETFCRAIGTQLSAELRLPLEFQVISTTQLSWASAIAELPAASLFGVMFVEPGGERALVACELPLLQYCLDRMLGGDGLGTPQRSELTEIELALSMRLMERLTSQLSAAWSEAVGSTFELRHVDTQITNVQLVTPSEAVLALTVEVTLERGSSTFTVVFPHVAVEPVLDQLVQGVYGERQQVDYDHGPVRAALLPIEVEMRVDVGSVELSIDEALRLVPGDVLEFGPVEGGVQLYGGETATHVCRPGRIGEFRAVEVLVEGPERGMTAEEALLLVGESIADAVAEVIRGFGAEVSRGPVSLAPKGEMAFQGLPPMGVVCAAAYVNGSTGGNVVVMGRRGARKLSLLASGGNPDDAGEGPLANAELAGIGEAAFRLIEVAATTTGALLEEPLELAPPTTRPYETTAEALGGLDLAPRATAVNYTVAEETIRVVHLIPNALLIRMTHVFDDREAARTQERFDGTDSESVPADSVREVTVTLRAELGRTRLPLIHASSLDAGAAVTLDRRVDDPVELFVNGRRFGTGELVATSGSWAVRITEITGVS